MAKKNVAKKPGAAKRSSVAKQPGAAKKPAAARKSGVAKKPRVAKKSGAAKKPAAAKKSSVAKKVGAAKKPGATKKLKVRELALGQRVRVPTRHGMRAGKVLEIIIDKDDDGNPAYWVTVGRPNGGFINSMHALDADIELAG